MKPTVLEMRGIYVRKAQRTRAHVFIVMLAYLIDYELRRQWVDLELTIEEGIAELASISSSIGETVGILCQTIPEPRPQGQQLLHALEIPFPEAIVQREVQSAPRKQLKGDRRPS